MNYFMKCLQGQFFIIIWKKISVLQPSVSPVNCSLENYWSVQWFVFESLSERLVWKVIFNIQALNTIHGYKVLD